MAISAHALEMRFAIRRLQRQHGIVATPVVVPPSAPTEHAQVLEGYASTSDVDLDCCRFRPYAFGFPLWFPRGFPPLYHKHDETAPVGRIEGLSYDDKGGLLIRAVVTHALARRHNAFSVGARVLAYTIERSDTPDFFALITAAEIIEVSTTDVPSNPHAVVRQRYPASPAVEVYAMLQQRVACLQQLVTLFHPQEARP